MTGTFLPLGPIYLACLIAAFLFAVRLMCAASSTKVSGQIRRHPVIHCIWGCFAYVGLVLFLAILNPRMSTWWPLGWIERLSQRHILTDRVRSAGGWDSVRHDCVSLVELHTNGFLLFWANTNGVPFFYLDEFSTNDRPLVRIETNRLPASIVALQPHDVEYAPKNGCVRFKFFGSHSTGGIIELYLGLEVDTSTNSVGYNHGAETEYRDWTYKKVAEGIYEIY
jgi:hypothetical protein